MAIDRIKERYINEMNAMTEAIKLGSELRRMDEGIPAAEKQTAWDNGIANIPSLLKQAKWDSMSRGATLTIAASNATAKSKAAADYVCDGTMDYAEINAAIVELAGIGGCVELSEGTFNATSPILINQENIWLKGQGLSTIFDFKNVAGGTMFAIKSRIKISDLQIINSLSNGVIIGEEEEISNVRLMDCKITNCNRGFMISDIASNCIITGNDLTGNTNAYTDSGVNTIIENNILPLGV